jgi:hypothetical protein
MGRQEKEGPTMKNPEEEEYYVVPVIPYEEGDYPEHNEAGFCDNMQHECHENPELIEELAQAVEDGEATPEDADRIYRGKTL